MDTHLLEVHLVEREYAWEAFRACTRDIHEHNLPHLATTSANRPELSGASTYVPLLDDRRETTNYAAEL
eukprot:scaffold2109_cov123-Isochrysis_galbana.AAC.12